MHAFNTDMGMRMRMDMCMDMHMHMHMHIAMSEFVHDGEVHGRTCSVPNFGRCGG